MTGEFHCTNHTQLLISLLQRQLNSEMEQLWEGQKALVKKNLERNASITIQHWESSDSIFHWIIHPAGTRIKLMLKESYKTERVVKKEITSRTSEGSIIQGP